MYTPRLNIYLFVAYAIISGGVFIAAMLLPQFRQSSYAPLRELLLPPPEPIHLSVLYSTEKEAWLEDMAARMQMENLRANGRPIQLQLEKTGSREMYLAVLDGSKKPDIISPASSLQVSILEELSAGKFPTPLVRLADRQVCTPVVTTPLVLVAWSERAEALWGAQPPPDLWRRLQSILSDPQGWSSLGKPEWGYVKFGHTDPTRSNSGFMTLLLMTYDYYQKSSGLQTQDILNNTEFQEWLKSLEAGVTEFGDSTGTYMRDIVAYGPSKYDIVAVYEATAIEQIENARGRYGELSIYYPPATVMSDHPFCILQADWVTPDKAAAARIFIDYLIQAPAQEAALLSYGFRPADASIPLDQTGSPFLRYAGNGLQINLPPQVEIPSGGVLDTLLNFWILNVQR